MRSSESRRSGQEVTDDERRHWREIQRKQRTLRQMSTRDLGERVGVSHAMISRWELTHTQGDAQAGGTRSPRRRRPTSSVLEFPRRQGRVCSVGVQHVIRVALFHAPGAFVNGV